MMARPINVVATWIALRSASILGITRNLAFLDRPTIRDYFDQQRPPVSAHMRCLDSRTYLRCALTEARGSTFVDMETGTDEGDEQADTDEQTRAFFIRLADKMIDGLRKTTG